MIIINASATIMAFTPKLEEVIEMAGRVAWKSEDKIKPGTAGPFIERIKDMQHESVLEHGSITVHFICDRGVSHELVRHRIASFTQESTRYCNYNKEKFDGAVTFIAPIFDKNTVENFELWFLTMSRIEGVYKSLVRNGATAQEARSVLPNSLKTEVYLTANPREWRHIFKMRTAKSAHPQMRQIMVPLLEQFKNVWPSIFGNL